MPDPDELPRPNCAFNYDWNDLLNEAYKLAVGSPLNDAYVIAAAAYAASDEFEPPKRFANDSESTLFNESAPALA